MKQRRKIKKPINKWVERVIHLIVGVVLYGAFAVFIEGKRIADESGYAGDSSGSFELISWSFGLLVSIVASIVIIPLLYYLLQLLSRNARSEYIPILVGCCLTPLVYMVICEIEFRIKVNNYAKTYSHVIEQQERQFISYQDVYYQVNDSIQQWLNDSIGVMSNEINSYPNILLDSLILFDPTKEIFESTLYSLNTNNESEIEASHRSIYGYKLNNRWIIFPSSLNFEYEELPNDFAKRKKIEDQFKYLKMINYVYNLKGEINPKRVTYWGVEKVFRDASINDKINILDSLLLKYKSIKHLEESQKIGGFRESEHEKQPSLDTKVVRERSMLFKKIKDKS